MKKNIRKFAAIVSVVASTLCGCGSSQDSFVFTNTTGGQGQAQVSPVANGDTFNALGNATINRAAPGVLSNDTLNGATISTFDATSANGGTVVLNADGSFTYTPTVGFQGSDSFTYRLQNSQGTSTATVTLNVQGLGVFVNNNAVAGGTGTQASPFNTLAQAIAAARSGDTIFVSRGNGTSAGLSGAFTLPSGVNLVGEGSGLIVPQTVVPAGTAPIVNGPITLSGSNRVQGIAFQDQQAGQPFLRLNNVNNCEITNNTFLIGQAFDGVEIQNVCNGITLSNNEFTVTTNTDAIGYTETLSSAVSLGLTVSNNQFRYQGAGNAESCLDFFMTGFNSTLDLTVTGNSFTGTGTGNGFDQGINAFLLENVNLTGRITGNQFQNFRTQAIQIQTSSDNTGWNLTVSDNTCSNTGEEFLSARLAPNSQGTLTMANNALSNGGGRGILADVGVSSKLVMNMTNSQFSGLADEALSVRLSSSAEANVTAQGCTVSNCNIGFRFIPGSNSDLTFRVLNNMFTAMTAQCINYVDSQTGRLCADISGNSFVTDVLLFNNGTGSIDLEQFSAGDGGPLNVVNTFSSGATVNTSGTITSRPDGFCTQP